MLVTAIFKHKGVKVKVIPGHPRPRLMIDFAFVLSDPLPYVVDTKER